MGAGASALTTVESLPEEVDKETLAKAFPGEENALRIGEAYGSESSMPRARVVELVGDAEKAARPKMSEHEEELALSTFKKMQLKGKLLQAMNMQRKALLGEEKKFNETEAVIDTTQLKQAFADMGDDIESKDIFALVQQADPEAQGVISLPLFMEVVRARREFVEEQKRKKHLMAAYVALGGTVDQDKSVKSDMLAAITTDFLGKGAAEKAMAAVVKHKMKAVQEVLDMGGALDSDEEEELKDTKTLAFDELEAFASALHGVGAELADAEPEDVADEEGVLR